MLTALGTMDVFDVGNFAVIAGKNAFDALVLILILMNVHTRHVRPEGPAIGYFIFVLLVPHLISALITSEGMLSLDGVTPHGLPVLAFIVVAAFCVSTTVNIILIAFVARTPKTAMSDDAPHAVVPGVLNQVQAAWNLSNREAEIVRLACTAANTARIASTLCIAESTVYTHLKRIYRKAGVHSRQELVDMVETFEK